MKVEFDWQVGSKTGEMETLARTAVRQRPRPPWWAWVLVATALSSVVTAAYLLVRQRYREAEDGIIFQIQSVIDLEARTFADGDRSLFLEQQDRDAGTWFAAQAARVGPRCDSALSSLSSGPESDSYVALDSDCEPVLPATIADLDLRGEFAWVEVIEGEPAVRRARFYRRTETGWVHTAPQTAFWGSPVEVRYGDLAVFRYRRRDTPHIDPIVAALVAAFEDVCASLSCPIDEAIELDFGFGVRADAVLQVEQGSFSFSSPWLVGIPVDENWSSGYVPELTRAVTQQLVTTHLQSMIGRELGPLERALAAEYAAWHSVDETYAAERAPIVARLVAAHGEDALPTILGSLEHVWTLNLIMAQWLDLSSSDVPEAYFGALIDIEREAIAAGRKETFLLLQDDTAPGWSDAQEERFDLAQRGPAELPAATVLNVSVSGDLARVTLAVPAGPFAGHPLSPLDSTVLFRRVAGDWKHTPSTREHTGAPVELVLYAFPLSTEPFDPHP